MAGAHHPAIPRVHTCRHRVRPRAGGDRLPARRSPRLPHRLLHRPRQRGLRRRAGPAGSRPRCPRRVPVRVSALRCRRAGRPPICRSIPPPASTKKSSPSDASNAQATGTQKLRRSAQQEHSRHDQARRGEQHPRRPAERTRTAGLPADAVGYWIGRRVGTATRHTRVGRWVGQGRWDRAQRLMSEHGRLAVVGGRLVGVLRPLIPPLAGMTRMSSRTYMLHNLLGGLLWVGGMCGGGYLLGRRPEPHHDAAGDCHRCAGCRRRPRPVLPLPAPQPTPRCVASLLGLEGRNQHIAVDRERRAAGGDRVDLLISVDGRDRALIEVKVPSGVGRAQLTR